MEGRIWPSQKFWRGVLYARPLAGRGEGKGEERNGKGEEGQKAGKGKEGKLEQGRRWAKAGPVYLHTQFLVLCV